MKTTQQNTQRTHNKKGGSSQATMTVFAWLNVVSPRSLLLIVLMLAVLGSALSVVNTSYKHRMVFHELQQARNQTNNFDVQWGQLLIEQSTFGLEGRIERRAMDELGMKLPDWSTIKMVRHE